MKEVISMESERIADYDVIPQVVLSGTTTKILIRPRGYHAAFKDDVQYIIKLVPTEIFNLVLDSDRFETVTDTLEVRPEKGAISFSYYFTDEQEWSVLVCEKEHKDDMKLFHIYSLLPDLYGKKAYKGDLHVHTCHSDGREEPAIVAANYRRAGFDFMAITDHHKWAPSKEVIDKYKNAAIDLKLFYGEEVHVPNGYIHAVNFGGSISVNEMYEKDRERIDREIREEAQKIAVPEGVDAVEFCYRKWIAENIRKGSGISILVHPFWYCDYKYHMHVRMTEYLLETGCYDAFELLGGQTEWENNMQVALYNDLRAKGIRIPIVGSSDSHGTEPAYWFNNEKTILFSEDLELDSIRRNIKDLYSVAVDTTVPGSCRVDGPYRMVKYALFLLKYYFPRHDELCFEEGVLMKNYVCGDEDSGNLLKLYSGRTRKFADQFFGQNT